MTTEMPVAGDAAPVAVSKDWKVFDGKSGPHRGLMGLAPPPWRRSDPISQPEHFHS
jgi:hypothetical protein